MPGMGGLGALGRFAGNMSGGNASYGMARHPGMPGKYMDVALHNRRQPGTPASQAVPKGLRMGDGIELLPPESKQASNDGGAAGETHPQAHARSEAPRVRTERCRPCTTTWAHET